MHKESLPWELLLVRCSPSLSEDVTRKSRRRIAVQLLESPQHTNVRYEVIAPHCINWKTMDLLHMLHMNNDNYQYVTYKTMVRNKLQQYRQIVHHSMIIL